MNVLIIGGSRFVGRQLAHRLVMRGDRVTLLNRGTLDDGLGDRAERLLADRGTDALDRALERRTFDAAIDFAAYDASHTERAVRVLDGRVGHYVFISTGQVYLARPGGPPSREEDAEGPVGAAPDDPLDLATWHYGVGKREAESVLARELERKAFPGTRVRLPTVHGPGDPERRIAGAVERLRNERPVAFPDARVRHVHGPTIASMLASLLGDARTIGRALNIAPEGTTTVLAVFERIARHLGSTAPLAVMSDEDAASERLAGGDPSPLGSRGMSLLDGSRAARELGLSHPDLDAWLPGVIDAAIAGA